MATIYSTEAHFYRSGVLHSLDRGLAGYESGPNARNVARYTFKTDSNGATAISFKTESNHFSGYGASGYEWAMLSFNITESSTEYINGDWNSDSLGAYSSGGGSASIRLKPNTTYYLWLYPNNSIYCLWRVGNSATITTSGSYMMPSTAPTSVSATSLVGRGKTTKVSWSGAVAGNGTTIAGYQVYIKAGSAPTISSYDSSVKVTTTATSGSYIYTMPTTQGTTVYFKVVTLSSGGTTYNSPISSSTGSTKVNTTPTISSVTPSVSYFGASNTGSITFTFNTSDADSHTINKQIYSHTGTLLGSTIGTTLVINMTTGADYLPVNNTTSDVSYVFTARVYDDYDGTAYKNSATCTITRYAKPIITGLTVTNGNSPSYRTETDNNTEPFVTLINASYAFTGRRTATEWYFRTQDSGSSSYGGAQKIGSTATSLSSYNILNNIKSFNTKYQIGVLIKNEFDSTAIYWKTSDYTKTGVSTKTYYYIAPYLDFRSLGNKEIPESVITWTAVLPSYTNTIASHFLDTITIKSTYNSLYKVKYELLDASGNFLASFGDQPTGSYGKVLKIPNLTYFSKARPTTFRLKIQTNYPDDSSSGYVVTALLTKDPENPLSGVVLTSGATSVKPIYENIASIYTPTFTKFWTDTGTGSFVNLAMPSDFSNFTLSIHIDDKSAVVHQGGTTNQPTSLSTDTQQWAYSGLQLYNWGLNPLQLIYGRTYVAYLKLTVTNYYERELSIDSSSFTLDLKELPRFNPAAAKSVLIKHSAPTGALLSSGSTTIVNEKNSLTFSFVTPIVYGGEVLKYYLDYSDNTSASPSSYTYLPTGLTFDSSNSQAPASFTQILSTTSQSYYRNYRIRVVGIGGTHYLYFNDYTFRLGKLQNISTASLSLERGSINEAQTGVSFNYILDDSGAGVIGSDDKNLNLMANGVTGRIQVSYEYSFDKINFTAGDSFMFNATTLTTMGASVADGIRAHNFELPKVEEPFLYIRLKVEVTSGYSYPDYNATYVSYSNVLTIPNIQPTMSVRKGCVGINNKSFDAEDVFVVNVSANRKYVRLTSADTDALINLETGEIDNFIIRGGTW